jgi:predicted DNA-binding transcriptional regulator YafY
MIRNTNETITVADIRVAMILGRPVTIDYEKADGTRTVRVVEPFEIVPREHVTNATKRPFFRAMDRQSRDFRSFRFDRVYAYRVANARGRYRVPRPAPKVTWWDETPDPSHTPAGVAPDGLGAPDTDALDTAWAEWLESQYDPDVTLADRLEDLEV